MSLIQTSSQKAAEIKEKLKIFDNEIDILRTSVANKEKYDVTTVFLAAPAELA